jgi:hypothetical protein
MQEIFIMSIISGFFGSDDGSTEYVRYTFSYIEADGLFEYEIENGDQDKEGVENVLGCQFARESEGFCTWTDLPKDIRQDFEKKLTPEQLFKAQMVAKTVIADGSLVISSDKANWEELEFKAKLLNKEMRGEL